MTGADFRRLALALPEAVEGSHHGHADFRVGKRIFATLGLEPEGYGVLILSQEEQATLTKEAPTVFSAVPNGWGRQGATRVLLKKVTPTRLKRALQVAWKRKSENQ